MRKLVVLGSALAVTLATGVPAFADQEKAGKALKRVAKNMNKLKSYKVTASVEGGMAQGEDHKITQATVRETYRCDVAKGFAHINGTSEAFRQRRGGEADGTIRDGSIWKGILGTDEGKLMARLFLRPETHFAKMMKHKRLAKWLPPEETAGGSYGDIEFEDEEIDFGDDAAKPAPAKKKKLKTKAGKSKRVGKTDANEGPISHKMRIVAPTQEAIEHFTTIVNSGCLSGG